MDPIQKAKNDPSANTLAVGMVYYNTVKFVTHE
jgi:hypothetical protein